MRKSFFLANRYDILSSLSYPDHQMYPINMSFSEPITSKNHFTHFINIQVQFSLKFSYVSLFNMAKYFFFKYIYA